MCARSHTSGLMIGECTRSKSWARGVRPARACALRVASRALRTSLRARQLGVVCEDRDVPGSGGRHGSAVSSLYVRRMGTGSRQVLSNPHFKCGARRRRGRGRVVQNHRQALPAQQARGHLAGGLSQRRAAPPRALPAPVAGRMQRRAARRTARLSVIRCGGGLGESCTPRHTASLARLQRGGPGEQRGHVAVGADAQHDTSSTGTPIPAGATPSRSSTA